MILDKVARVSAILRKFHIQFLVDIMEYAVPGMRNKLDPWLYSMMMGQVSAAARPDQVPTMRKWKASTWKKVVDEYVDDRKMIFASTLDQSTTPSLVSTTSPPPPAPPPPPSGGGGGGDPSGGGGDDPPPWLTPIEKAAWSQARGRAGELIRGLGNYTELKTGKLIVEVWQGETITQEASKPLRLQTVETVRELTSQGIEEGWNPKKLAQMLRKTTKDFARNWQRIANTEMQAAYNDGAAIYALEVYGSEEAFVARVPNAGHCESCADAFLDDSGKPIIFKVTDLIANGTNAGKKKSSWLPTLWPLHPNCRCDTQIVPPGFVFDDTWGLERDPEA
jgi:hypothetical protein